MKKQYLTPTATLVALPKEEFVTASGLSILKKNSLGFEDDNEDIGAPIFSKNVFRDGTFD